MVAAGVDITVIRSMMGHVSLDTTNHYARANMETKRRAIRFRQRRPISARFFKQAECAVDVGANKIVGAVDGPVDMALGGEMNDRARLFAPKQIAQTISVDDVAPLKAIARIAFDGSQVLEIAGVSQLVEIDDPRTLRGNPLENEIRADEARATGNQDSIFHASRIAAL